VKKERKTNQEEKRKRNPSLPLRRKGKGRKRKTNSYKIEYRLSIDNDKLAATW
jgi:hypothetical protein